MIFGNCIIELKLVEKLRLFALQPSHHGLPPPRFVSARWNHGSPQASTTSATKSVQKATSRAFSDHVRSPLKSRHLMHVRVCHKRTHARQQIGRSTAGGGFTF